MCDNPLGKQHTHEREMALVQKTKAKLKSVFHHKANVHSNGVLYHFTAEY